MDDDNSKSLRERLDALLRRAREISAEIEKRVEEVTAEPSTSGTGQGAPTAKAAPGAAPDHQLTAEKVAAAQEAMEVAAEAVAVSAEAAAVTAEALSTIAAETGTAPAVPPGTPTTVVPEAATAVAQDATGASREDAANKKAPAVAPVSSAPPAAEAKAVTQAAPDKKPDDKS
jgi:hypothetical protein